MIEKIKETDFLNISEEDSNILLSELLSLDDNTLEEKIIEIVDELDYNLIQEDTNYKIVDKIFKNERISQIIEKINNDLDD